MSFDISQWQSANTILIPNSAPASELIPVFFNSYTPSGPARGAWTTVDVTSMVDVNTVAINLTGILIITHGTTSEDADLRLYFRRDNTTTPSYIVQCIEPFVGGGQRCTMSCWVPLTPALTFDWMWDTAVYSGAWPTYSAFGANCQIDAIAVNN